MTLSLQLFWHRARWNFAYMLFSSKWLNEFWWRRWYVMWWSWKDFIVIQWFNWIFYICPCVYDMLSTPWPHCMGHWASPDRIRANPFSSVYIQSPHLTSPLYDLYETQLSSLWRHHNTFTNIRCHNSIWHPNDAILTKMDVIDPVFLLIDPVPKY